VSTSEHTVDELREAYWPLWNQFSFGAFVDQTDRLRAAEAELAALKARRCETCKWWWDCHVKDGHGQCYYPGDDGTLWWHEDIRGGCAAFTTPDFYCAAHEPRESVPDA
jgi:hypothetical protein